VDRGIVRGKGGEMPFLAAIHCVTVYYVIVSPIPILIPIPIVIVQGTYENKSLVIFF
jgi:hypothetical protein